MKRLIFIIAILGIVVGICLSLTSKRPTYLRVHTESEPQTLDPSLATGLREFQILQAIFEGLTRYDPQNLTPLPGVAEKWEISPDGLHYTFHLRANAKWSDGQLVTAQDFWNSWERLLNPATHSNYAFQLFYLKNGEAYTDGKIKDPAEIGMKVVDPRTFEVTLENPVPYFLSLTSFSALVPLRKEANPVYLINNGAFKFKSHTSKEGIILEANENYWGKEEIKIPGVQIRPFGNFATALKFYGGTGIDIMADVPPTQVPLLKFRYDFRSAPIFRTEYFDLNCKAPPLDKVEVRKALAYAVQREIITDQALQRGDIPNGFFVPPIPGYQSPERGQTFDVEKAKQLLKAAGFNGKGFPVLQIHYNNATDRQIVAQTVQKMWKENLGLDTQLVVEEWGDYLSTRRKKNFQISWGGWTGDYLDPNTFLELFTTGLTQNYSNWSNPKYDALIQKAKVTADTKKRAQLMREAEQILLDEAPVIPVLIKTKTYLIQPYVRGYYSNLTDIHPLRDVYSLRP